MPFLRQETPESLESVLLVRSHPWYCAFPVTEVTETCRPLPVQHVDGVPAFVRGVAVVRGAATPVLHLGLLLSGGQPEKGRRYVNVRVHGRPVAFEVDEVVGVRSLSRVQLASASSLASGALTHRITEVGVLDGELLAFLESARLVQNDLLDLVLAERWA